GALCAAATLAAAAPASAAPPPEVYAVVVGYNGGGAGLPPLRFADDDAVRFAFLFGALDAAGRPSHVSLLADLDEDTRRGLARAGLQPPAAAPPTRAALLAALADVGRALAGRPAGAPPAV